MKIRKEQLGDVNVLAKVVRATLQVWNEDTVLDYETHGRSGDLLYYVLDNEMECFSGKKKIFTANKNDIIFFPSGSKYTFAVRGSENSARGIGIVFELTTHNGHPITIDSSIQILAHDTGRYFYDKFHKVYLSTVDPCGSTLLGKANLYSLLDDCFSFHTRVEERKNSLHNIFNAKHALEHNLDINYTNEQLASFCYMSVSTFLRKFKEYSGGVTPLQYRNCLRLTRAEELINTTMTIDEIAAKLGFCDGAHLCKMYKKQRGHTLKKRKAE